jgi:DNA-binding NarL/FixJ family response regulator
MVSDHTPEGAAPIRLLVVDDDAGIRTLLEVSVRLDPRFVLAGSAATGSDCMATLTASPDEIDAVLLDVTLPDVDGIELLPKVRDAAAGARIALFTGWSDPETLDRARAAGADAVFAKDGEPRRLLDGIAALCE